MASRAVMRQSNLGVWRIVCVVEVCRMAGVAIRGRSCKHVVDVAGSARQSRMGSGERIARVFQMVELRVKPTVHRVATLACRRELACDVVDHWRQEVFLVARIASSREALELATCRILMALIALHESVSSNERKAIVVILDRVKVDLPTHDRVTAFAVGSELAAMNVRMAVRALLAHVLKDEICVALCTAHLDVHAAERISSLIVVELRIRTNRFPARVSMAILAWD